MGNPSNMLLSQVRLVNDSSLLRLKCLIHPWFSTTEPETIHDDFEFGISFSGFFTALGSIYQLLGSQSFLGTLLTWCDWMWLVNCWTWKLVVGQVEFRPCVYLDAWNETGISVCHVPYTIHVNYFCLHLVNLYGNMDPMGYVMRQTCCISFLLTPHVNFHNLIRYHPTPCFERRMNNEALKW